MSYQKIKFGIDFYICRENTKLKYMEHILSQLDKLIKEGEQLTQTIYSNQSNLYTIYKSYNEQDYQKWILAVNRLIKTTFPSEKEEIHRLTKNISPHFHTKILAMLNSLKRFPNEPVPMINNNANNHITINNNQTQNNNQSIVLNIFLEAIKDEIKGKELKELKKIIKEYENEPEKTKETLIAKIKKIGEDVLSNIIANILTNPSIYSAL